MKHTFFHRPRWQQAAIALLVLPLSGWAVNEARIRFPIRSHSMNEYTQNLKTICVGRYLWDVPQQATLPPLSQTINRIKIERMPKEVASSRLLSLRLEEYERELKQELVALKNSSVKQSLPLGSGRIFVYYKEDPNLRVANIVGYQQIGNWIYQFTSEASTKYLEEELGNMKNVIAAIRPRADNEIPTSLGVCIDGAFVAGKEFEDESVGADFELPGYPGFSMLLAVMKGIEPPTNEKIIERTTRNWTLGGLISDVTYHRKAPITLLGQSGEELMISFEEKGQKSLSADAEIYGDGSMARQGYVFKMSNDTHDELGTPHAAVFPDDKAKAIWDAVLKTLRLRPGAA